ncbi:MAG: helix-hairpin-helix domain-containing protein, partial [Calditrichaeota bacterium]|nr:helix-hairpin-helix domain-containing protein [Calditrichota bacterium]
MYCIKSIKHLILKPIFYTLCALVFFQISDTIYSQEIDPEKLLENETESKDQSELLEYLQTLQQHPININTASMQQLETIPWITPSVANLIVSFRKKKGPFSGIEELKKIPGINDETFTILRHFLSTQKKQRHSAFTMQGRQRTFLRFEKSKGFGEKKYPGGRQKVYNRIKFALHENVQFGVLTEKDPGEKPFNDLGLAFAHIHWPRMKTEILFGNYTVECGQGLVFWGPYRLSKGSDPILPMKQRPRGLRAYSSVDENAGFAGVAVKSVIGPIDLISFYSNSKLDARIDSDSVRSLGATGYHRTKTELGQKDTLGEKVVGISATGRFRSLVFGTTHQFSKYNLPLVRKTGIDHFYDFRGNVNRISGVNFDFTRGVVNLFGEAAQSANRNNAVIFGGWLDFKTFDFVLSARHYDKGFVNFHGFSFGETDQAANENGFYLGWKWRLKRGTTLSFYFDQFSHPWLKTYVPMPDKGWEAMTMLEHRIRDGLSVSLRLKAKKRDDADFIFDEFGNSIKKLVAGQKINIRAQMDYEPQNKIHLRTRLEYATINWDKYGLEFSNLSDSTGMLLYQDFMFRPLPQISIRTRWCYFDAPLYDLRFYVYENDLPG